MPSGFGKPQFIPRLRPPHPSLLRGILCWLSGASTVKKRSPRFRPSFLATDAPAMEAAASFAGSEVEGEVVMGKDREKGRAGQMDRS